MVSLRDRVNTWRKENLQGTRKELYKTFKDNNKNSLRTYYNSYVPDPSDISEDIILDKLDTIKEMVKTIQLIKDPDKRATQLSRLHAMKLKPIANTSELSLKEMLDS